MPATTNRTQAASQHEARPNQHVAYDWWVHNELNAPRCELLGIEAELSESKNGFGPREMERSGHFQNVQECKKAPSPFF